jgi:hypothetical protein
LRLYASGVRIAWLVLLLVTLAVLGASCGGDEASGEGETTAVETITATETTGEETGATETETETDTAVEGLASEECLQLVAIGAVIGQAVASAEGGSAEPPAFLDEIVAKAPEEIAGDLEILAAAYREYADVIADLDLKEGQTPSGEDLQKIQSAISSLDDPEVQAAAERVSAWAEENCPSG